MKASKTKEPGSTEWPEKKPILVAIAGGSGSGKTWLADKLQKALGRAALRLSLDSFYRDRSKLSVANRARVNFDNPRAIDWPRVEAVLSDLMAGRPASLPVYDFKTHSRLANALRISPRSVILIEGLWPIRRREIRRIASLTIFVECPASLRFQRRLARDQSSRGRTKTSVRRQFRDCVEPMHQRFVAAQAKAADLSVSGRSGPGEIRKLAILVRQLVR